MSLLYSFGEGRHIGRSTVVKSWGEKNVGLLVGPRRAQFIVFHAPQSLPMYVILVCSVVYFLCGVLVRKNKETSKKQRADKTRCVGISIGTVVQGPTLGQFQGYPRCVVSVFMRACPEWVHFSRMVSVSVADVHRRVPEKSTLISQTTKSTGRPMHGMEG